MADKADYYRRTGQDFRADQFASQTEDKNEYEAMLTAAKKAGRLDDFEQTVRFFLKRKREEGIATRLTNEDLELALRPIALSDLEYAKRHVKGQLNEDASPDAVDRAARSTMNAARRKSGVDLRRVVESRVDDLRREAASDEDRRKTKRGRVDVSGSPSKLDAALVPDKRGRYARLDRLQDQRKVGGFVGLRVNRGLAKLGFIRRPTQLDTHEGRALRGVDEQARRSGEAELDKLNGQLDSIESRSGERLQSLQQRLEPLKKTLEAEYAKPKDTQNQVLIRRLEDSAKVISRDITEIGKQRVRAREVLKPRIAAAQKRVEGGAFGKAPEKSVISTLRKYGISISTPESRAAELRSTRAGRALRAASGVTAARAAVGVGGITRLLAEGLQTKSRISKQRAIANDKALPQEQRDKAGRLAAALEAQSPWRKVGAKSFAAAWKLVPARTYVLLAGLVVGLFVAVGNILGYAALQAAMVSIATLLNIVIIAPMNAVLLFFFGTIQVFGHAVIGVVNGFAGWFYQGLWDNALSHIPGIGYARPTLVTAGVTAPQFGYLASLMSVGIHEDGSRSYSIPSFVFVNGDGVRTDTVFWQTRGNGFQLVPDLTTVCAGDHCDVLTWSQFMSQAGGDWRKALPGCNVAVVQTGCS